MKKVVDEMAKAFEKKLGGEEVDLLSAAIRIASTALRHTNGELLRKALIIAVAVAEFDEELIGIEEKQDGPAGS